MIRIVIIEGQPFLRIGLVNAISQFILPTMEVCGEASCESEGIELIAKTLPDIVLLNLDLPGMGGIEVTAAIKQKFKCKVIILANIADPEVVALALDSGVDSYLLASSDLETLKYAIVKTYEGQVWIDQKMSRTFFASKYQKPKKPLNKGKKFGITLTNTEIRTLKLMARGLSNEKIAEIHNVSLGTVKSCVYTINQKLEARNRVQAIIRGILFGYLSYNTIILEALSNDLNIQ
ncbi:response regulator transcription factor [Komarekiella sp. 'clone 1']|uniref:Response regulator transcription factor n=1 Tax=Komarekiella delphini-convector SJRDD-AB1 TaxID=2593771 RepID=A0AA40VUQ4_9NOST|nr:response regulator transcription factor [Komarekiella delphini-convector]MBD6620472.1 response regulator transcription factor [Komarekiella delphini-convector SJRDD-AB1]